ncbi:hypothetical protein RB597_000903 [Gaeumannomyces tritici]
MAVRPPSRHTPLQTALAALTLLLSVTSTAATTLGSSSSSKRALCLASRSAELADLAACGHAGSISYCLSHPAQSWPAAGGLGQVLGYGAVVEAADIQRCFVDAGCTRREAAVEAEWALRRCDELGDSPSMADLRRRHHHHHQNHGREAAAAAAAATPAPRILDARQTQGGTTTTTTAAPPAASAATTATTSSPPQTAVCRTTRTISTTTCPVQTTGPESGRQLPCFPTGLAVAECLPGWRCGSDRQGNQTTTTTTCDRLDDRVPTAGVVIGLVLAVAAVAGAATICFCCCRERREHRSVRRAAEAAAIARGAYPPVGDEAATAAPGSGDGEGDRKPLVLQSQQQQYDPFADSQAYQPYQQQRQ